MRVSHYEFDWILRNRRIRRIRMEQAANFNTREMLKNGTQSTLSF